MHYIVGIGLLPCDGDVQPPTRQAQHGAVVALYIRGESHIRREEGRFNQHVRPPGRYYATVVSTAGRFSNTYINPIPQQPGQISWPSFLLAKF
jgi:hypothetical protein